MVMRFDKMITKARKCYDYQILSNNSLGKSTEISLDKLYWGFKGRRSSIVFTKPQGHRPSKFQRACSELIHHIIEAFKKEIKLGRKLLVQVHFFKVWDRELLDSESKRPYTVLEIEKGRKDVQMALKEGIDWANLTVCS